MSLDYIDFIPELWSMAFRKLSNYLRMYRKRACLSQQEVAFLLGCTNSGKMSRYEHYARRPNLETLFAFEAVFGAPARELFAGEFEKVEEKIKARAQRLSEFFVNRKLDLVNQRKLEALWAVTCGWGLSEDGPS
jgi:transcriptional regulator with XRE-family HTH domain